jgi:hypothetical protein
MPENADPHKVENEVLDYLAEVRDEIKDMHPDAGLTHRLDGIEATLGALAVYTDKAFAEIRGQASPED